MLDFASLVFFFSDSLSKSDIDHAGDVTAWTARVLNKAAHHSMSNVLTAFANFDLLRRDVCQRTCCLRPILLWLPGCLCLGHLSSWAGSCKRPEAGSKGTAPSTHCLTFADVSKQSSPATAVG